MSAAGSRKVKVGAVKAPSDAAVDKALSRNPKTMNNAPSGLVSQFPVIFVLYM